MSSIPANAAPEARQTSRRTLLALIALTIAPVAASYFTYYVIKPRQAHTVGDLLSIQPLPTLPALNLDGQPTDLRSLRGKWVLLIADSGSCAQSCQNLLFTLRQLRLAQGREMGRIERLMLVRDAVPQHLPDTAAGVHVWRDTGGLTQRLPVAQQADVSRFIYVIDPLGNQVLRYRDDTEPRAIIRELGKLLKNNQGLG